VYSEHLLSTSSGRSMRLFDQVRPDGMACAALSLVTATRPQPAEKRVDTKPC
jgi:hypothetical protein